MPFCEEGMRDHRLENEDYGTNHLRDGFDLSENACRNYDAALTCYNEANACYRKLAKENYQDDPNEDHSLQFLAAKYHPKENGYHGCKNHKFIRKGVDELAKVGYKIVLSRNLAVKHIGKGGKSVDNCGYDESPDRVLYKEQSYYKYRHKNNSHKRECVRNIKWPFFHFQFSHFPINLSFFYEICKDKFTKTRFNISPRQ